MKFGRGARKLGWAIAWLTILGSSAVADQVVLTSGQVIEGKIQDPSEITTDTEVVSISVGGSWMPTLQRYSAEDIDYVAITGDGNRIVDFPDITAVPNPAADGQAWSLAECGSEGKRAASLAGTGGSALGGFIGGLTLGLIGTAIAYAVQGPPDSPSIAALPSGEDCRYVYLEEFNRRGKSAKRNAALAGGVLGTIGIVAVFLSANL